MIEVACALLIDKNKILITQNGETSDHAFQWEFPGGKIKAEETAEEGMIREIREELELDVEVIDSLVPLEYDYGLKKVKLLPFVCKITSGDMRLNAHVDHKWVRFEELNTVDFSEADKKMISLPENSGLIKKYSWE